MTHFGKQGIEGLLADREFASGQLFKWLNKKKIPFYIRIKQKSQVRVKGKKFKTAQKLFKQLNIKKQMVFGMDVEVFGAKIFLSGSRSERGELMIVATNQDPKNAIARYLRRWEIENLFQGLKGRGFRFEETHLTDQTRIAKLLALVSIGFCWAHIVGEWQAQQKPIRMKRFKYFQTPQQTFFRHGLDLIRDALLHSDDESQQIKLKDCMDVLKKPPLKIPLVEALI